MSQIKYPNDLIPRGNSSDDYKDSNHSSVEISDPYRELENPDSDITRAWVESENQLTEEYLSQVENVEQLRHKLIDNQYFNKVTLPEKNGKNFYFFYNADMYQFDEKDFCEFNNENPLEGTTLFLPQNSSPKGEQYDWESSVWSSDGSMIAYVTDSKGSDWKTIRVKDVATKQDLENDVITRVKFSIPIWDLDNSGFFYARYDETLEDGTKTEKIGLNRVYYHKIGTKQAEDPLIYENPNEPDCSFSVYKTLDAKYLMLTTKRSTEDLALKHFVEMDSIKDYSQKFQFYPIIDEWKGSFAYLHNVGSKFYFITNYKAPQKRIVTFDIMFPQEENWQTILSGDEQNVIESCYFIKDRLIVNYLHNTGDVLKVYDMLSSPTEAKFLQNVDLPEFGQLKVQTGESNDNVFLINYSSYTQPETFYRLNLETLELIKFFKNEAMVNQTGYNSEEYTSDFVYFKSKDGTDVPMSIIRKKSVLPNLDQPPTAPVLTHMYAYGGFGTTEKPDFSLMDVIFYRNLQGIKVIVHTRGGGEFGEDWHRAGEKEHRQNVFDDFIAAAEHLIQKKYTDPNHLVISGESNGGTLMSVAVNQRPDLFALARIGVPVTDMLRFQKFTAGIKWVDEYGSSDEDGAIDYLLKYSPIHNVKKQKYPMIFLQTGDHDDRVVPLHSYKFMATLQYEAGEVQGQNPLLIEIAKDSGHNGGSDHKQPLQDEAQWYALMAEVTNTTIQW